MSIISKQYRNLLILTGQIKNQPIYSNPDRKPTDLKQLPSDTNMSSYNSFTARIYIDNYALPCALAFQHLQNSISGNKRTGGGRTGQPVKNSGGSGATTLLSTDYLYANTVSGAKAALFHFKNINDAGRYSLTCMDQGENFTKYLGMSNLGYTRAYASESDETHFMFANRSGKLMMLSDLSETNNPGLRMHCDRGNVNLYEKEYAYGSDPDRGDNTEWSAYTGVDTGGEGVAGAYRIVIVQRDVERPY